MQNHTRLFGQMLINDVKRTYSYIRREEKNEIRMSVVVVVLVINSVNMVGCTIIEKKKKRKGERMKSVADFNNNQNTDVTNEMRRV